MAGPQVGFGVGWNFVPSQTYWEGLDSCQLRGAEIGPQPRPTRTRVIPASTLGRDPETRGSPTLAATLTQGDDRLRGDQPPTPSAS